MAGDFRSFHVPVETRPLTLNNILVMDADVHVSDTPEALAPYVDGSYRRVLEHASTLPRRYLDIPGYAPSLALDLPLPDRGAGARSVETARQMREDLDAMAIDLAVLFPDHLLALAALPDETYSAALARAYNAWLADQWVSREQALYGAIVAAPQDPEDAAREIRRYGSESGFVAVYLPTAGVHPLWGSKRYTPVFEAASELNLPVMFHSVGMIHPAFPFNVDQFRTTLFRHPMQHEFALMANMFSLLETAVPSRFPDLRVVFAEGGISWVPYTMWRLDKEYHEYRSQAPLLEHPPSHYIRQFYFSTQPVEEPERPQDLVTMLDLFDGADRVLFASDWPHHDFDHPRQVFNMPFAGDVKRKIMGGNALALFGIEPPLQRGED